MSLTSNQYVLSFSITSIGTIRDPYIGPRPFKRDKEDQSLFFGRDDENDEILSLISAHKLVLIYAQSGAGKTSIFNAQVIPTLESYGFEVLPVARVKIALQGDSSPSPKDNMEPLVTSNLYIFNALQTLSPSLNSKELMKKTLSEFLYDHFPKKIDENGDIVPQVLIFDQLEELFTFYPEKWKEQRHDFFDQIAQALEKNSSLKVVFVIREDYLAELDPYVRGLPEKLRPRFRLERLRQEAALSAIEGPLKNTIFSPGGGSDMTQLEEEIKKIVNELLKIQVEDPLGGTHQLEGEYVEPIHLQVVCQRWWKERITYDNKESDRDSRELTDVDKALEEFYSNAVQDAAKFTKVSEKEIREWCEYQLITSSETRGIVHQSGNSTAGISNGVVEILDRRYLIRKELRSGGTWYELTHDRLVKPIKNSNLKWKADEGKIKAKRHRIILIPSAVAAIVIAAYFISSIYISPLPQDLPLGQAPTYLSVNPQTNKVYASNSDSNTVSVIDGTTHKVTANIPMSHTPRYLSVNPQTNKVYASNSDSNTVSVIDGTTNKLTGNITLGDIPLRQTANYISFNPQTNKVYVAGSNSTYGVGSITVLDGTSHKVISENIPIRQSPKYVSVNPQTNKVYVLGYDISTAVASLTVINGKTDQIISENDIPLYGEPSKLSINPGTNVIYVLSRSTNPYGNSPPDRGSVIAINGTTNEVIGNVNIETTISDMLVDLKTDTTYVATYNSTSETGSIAAINGTTHKAIPGSEIDIKDLPLALHINAKTDTIYVATYNSESETGSITAINGTTHKAIPGSEIPLEQDPVELLVNPETNIIYMHNGSSISNTGPVISAINGTTLKAIPGSEMSTQECCIFYVDPDTNTMFLAGYNSTSEASSITAINGTTYKAIPGSEIPLEQELLASDINAKTNIIYVATFNSTSETGSITAINSTTLKAIPGSEIPLEQKPIELFVNPETNTIYVPTYDSTSKTISIIAINGTTYKAIPGSEIPLEQEPLALHINAKTNTIYVATYDYNSGTGSITAINGTTYKAIPGSEIPLEQEPLALHINAKTNTIYVATYNSTSETSSITAINGTSHQAIPGSEIPLEQEPLALYINVKTNTIYVATDDYDSETGTITALNAVNGTTLEAIPGSEIPLEQEPLALHINAKTNTIYVATYNSTSETGSITAINGTNNEVIGNITEGMHSISDMAGLQEALFTDPNANTTYILHSSSPSDNSSIITVIDGTTNKPTGNITLGDIPLRQTANYISFNPQTNKVYVAGSNSTYGVGSITVLDATSHKVISENIPISQSPKYMSVNPQTNKVYIATSSQPSLRNSESLLSPYSPIEDSAAAIAVLDGKTDQVISEDKIPLKGEPDGLYVNPDTNVIYVATGVDLYGSTSSSLTVIEGKTYDVIDEITLNPTRISSMSGNPQTNMTYVLGSDSLTIINDTTNSIVMDMTIHKNIYDLSINPETNMLYVSDIDSNTVYAIDGTQNRIKTSIQGPTLSEIKVGEESHEVAANLQTNMTYVLGSDSITAINGTTNKVDYISLEGLYDLTINPSTNNIYAIGSSINVSTGYHDTVVTIINGTSNEVIGNITEDVTSSLGERGEILFTDPSTNMIYVAGSPVVGINATTNRLLDDYIGIDTAPSGISFNPNTNTIYLAGQDFSGEGPFVIAINGTTHNPIGGSEVQLDYEPNAMYVNNETNMIYVAGYNSTSEIGYITAINGNSNEVLSQYAIPDPGPFPVLDVNTDTNMIYVATPDSNYITIINGSTNELVDYVNLERGFSDLSINPKTHTISVLSTDDNQKADSNYITTINNTSNEIIDDFPIFTTPESDLIEVNPYTNMIYVPSETSESLSVINGTRY